MFSVELFADHRVLVEDSKRNLLKNLDLLNRDQKIISIRIKVNKTRTMIISNRDKSLKIVTEGYKIKHVSDLKYLGSITEANNNTKK